MNESHFDNKKTCAEDGTRFRCDFELAAVDRHQRVIMI